MESKQQINDLLENQGYLDCQEINIENVKFLMECIYSSTQKKYNRLKKAADEMANIIWVDLGNCEALTNYKKLIE